MKKINRILEINRRIWITVLIAFAFMSTSSVIVENGTITSKIEEFKKKGVYQENFSNNYTKFYIVPRETSSPYESSFYISSDLRLLPGHSGDILTDRQSSFEQIPFVNEFVTSYIGGHSAIVLADYKDNKISSDEGFFAESTGLNENNNEAQISLSGIRDINGPRKETLGLRVNTSVEKRITAANNVLSLVGNPYNYSFLLNTKRSNYCTDLIVKAYEKVDINLNYDYGPTTVLDLDMSKETYIFYYKFRDSNNVTHVYYLDDLDNKQDISGTIF